jgi:hypothetical protein
MERITMNRKIILATLAALVLTLNACGKKEEPKPQVAPAPTTAPAPVPPPVMAGVAVGSVTLGNAIGVGMKVAQAADSFAKKDTIYASVDTTGSGTATLKAKWTYRKGGQESLVKEDKQTIAPTGPASSEFHISKPDGWPAGDYQVEIFVDDKLAQSKSFTVK